MFFFLEMSYFARHLPYFPFNPSKWVTNTWDYNSHYSSVLQRSPLTLPLYITCITPSHLSPPEKACGLCSLITVCESSQYTSGDVQLNGVQLSGLIRPNKKQGWHHVSSCPISPPSPFARLLLLHPSSTGHSSLNVQSLFLSLSLSVPCTPFLSLWSFSLSLPSNLQSRHTAPRPSWLIWLHPHIRDTGQRWGTAGGVVFRGVWCHTSAGTEETWRQQSEAPVDKWWVKHWTWRKQHSHFCRCWFQWQQSTVTLVVRVSPSTFPFNCVCVWPCACISVFAGFM